MGGRLEGLPKMAKTPKGDQMSKISSIARNKWFLSSATLLALIEVVAAPGKWY